MNKEQSAPTEGAITINRDTMYGIVIAVLACLLVLSVFTQGFGVVKTPQVCPNVTGQCQPSGQNASETQPPAVATLQAPSLISQAPSMGPAGSAVSVVEFSDFQCPFCGLTWGSPWGYEEPYKTRYAAILGTVQKIETEYVDTGKISFIHYPVAFLSQESVDASVAALCAKAQGKYWEMHDAIYIAQTPEENDGKYSKANLKLLAHNITGLDAASFDTCLDNDTSLSEVQALTDDWGTTSRANIGTSGTPTVYILAKASGMSQDRVSSAASAGGFEWGKTGDGSTYIIIASPEYEPLKAALDVLLA